MKYLIEIFTHAIKHINYVRYYKKQVESQSSMDRKRMIAIDRLRKMSWRVGSKTYTNKYQGDYSSRYMASPAMLKKNY